MKDRKLIRSLLLFFSLAIFTAILFTNDNTVAKAANYISISDKTLTLELGHYKNLKVYGTTSKPTWRSSNDWIASVSSSGRVTAKASGTATITATVNGQKVSCKLTVLRLKKKVVTLAPNQTEQLILEGTKSKANWTSSDKTVATVSDTGLITAKGSGTATITASVDGKNLTSKVTVIDINEKELTLASGSSKSLNIANAKGKVSWSSNNTSIATVSSSGKVTAKNAGTATITGTVDGTKITSKVTVLKMNKESLTLSLNQTGTLKVDGTNSDITWSSSNKDVATVSKSGKVTTKDIGTATITASVDGKTFTSKITVVGISHNSIVLELGGWSGYTKTLNVNGSSKGIKWSSGNNSVATVTDEGKVSATGAGSTTITATVNGEKLTTKVKVLKASAKSFNLDINSVKALKVYGTSEKVTWTSNHKSVATVSNDGIVTPKSVGSAIIFGYVDGRNVMFNVNVVDPNQTSVALEIGGWSGNVKTLQIEGASGKITWSSSNKDVVTVSDSGKVVAQGVGSATITADIDGTKITYNVVVLKASENQITLKKGEAKKLKVLGTSDKVIWTSNQKSMATVSSNGTVTAKAKGSCIIFGTVNGRNVMFNLTVK